MIGQPSRRDPLAELASDPPTATLLAAARAEIDALLWRRDVRTHAVEVATASVERGARDSAAIDGADLAVPDASPMGRVLDAAMRLTAAVPGQVDVFATSPLQALAHLHALTATGFAPDVELGRPRSGERADDPLHLGGVPSATVAAERLSLLARTLTTPTEAPALLVAAIAHAELAVIRPFTWGSGMVARAAVRLVTAGRGVDPSLFSIPEHGMFEMGRPAYVRALQGYASGTREGVLAFIGWQAAACAQGAAAVRSPFVP
ncbi:MAG: oxidoreductase [Actinobacteria bacterium]|uniref:Unannotated protein n=1 Tax=freshwater metagenome TaxID=449393 RepID=A0A6J7LBE3_9ZZZZ|nr:oxidoreductase [Actinomycetota bacterium]